MIYAASVGSEGTRRRHWRCSTIEFSWVCGPTLFLPLPLPLPCAAELCSKTSANDELLKQVNREKAVVAADIDKREKEFERTGMMLSESTDSFRSPSLPTFRAHTSLQKLH